MVIIKQIELNGSLIWHYVRTHLIVWQTWYLAWEMSSDDRLSKLYLPNILIRGYANINDYDTKHAADTDADCSAFFFAS